MASIRVEIDQRSMSKFFKDIKNLQHRTQTKVAKSVIASSYECATTAKRLCPVDDGRLRSSIEVLNKRKDNLGTIVGTNVAYAAHVEYGTRPHVIEAKGDGYLKFKVDGQWINTKKVNHPGTKAQPFLYPAFNESTRGLLKDINYILKTGAK